MANVRFITHPDVLIDPAVPVTECPLSPAGRARMHLATQQHWAKQTRAIWSSTERKATDAAEILGAAIGLPYNRMASLGEIDRSSTGYLAREDFEETVGQFFANPRIRYRGWERAADAQWRIERAVKQVLTATPEDGDVAIIAHGAVGALLLCILAGVPISRSQDQPPGNGGFYFAFDRTSWTLRHGWRRIDG